MSYWAVSDLNSAEMREFAMIVRRQIAAKRQRSRDDDCAAGVTRGRIPLTLHRLESLARRQPTAHRYSPFRPTL